MARLLEVSLNEFRHLQNTPMFQKDISIEHQKRRGPGDPAVVYVMHPFKNTKRKNAGRYEILRDFKDSIGRKKKSSAHVTDAQLAELFARDLMSSQKIRMRVKPADQPYPTSPPAKSLRAVHVRAGSAFDFLMKSVDVSISMDAELVGVLSKLGVVLT